MANGSDKEKLIEFKAEVKLDLKYLREGTGKLVEEIKELTKKVNSQCTEIAILKTKILLYAGFASAIVTLAISFAFAMLKG